MPERMLIRFRLSDYISTLAEQSTVSRAKGLQLQAGFIGPPQPVISKSVISRPEVSAVADEKAGFGDTAPAVPCCAAAALGCGFQQPACMSFLPSLLHY